MRATKVADGADEAENEQDVIKEKIEGMEKKINAMKIEVKDA